MRMVQLKIYQYIKPFKNVFSSSHLVRKEPESVIVKIDFDNGIHGVGETIPRSYVTGEDCASVAKVIQDCFAPILFSNDIEAGEDILDVLHELESVCRRREIHDYNAALAAIDLALLDGLGKWRGVPVGNFLGPVVRDSIPYSISIPLIPISKIKEFYPIIQTLNFDFIKVVLGDNETDNIEKVKFIKSLLGHDIPIQVDANGNWTLDQAIANIKKLQALNIFAVEQPLPKSEIAQLAELKEKTGIPIALDESICSISEARRYLEKEVVDFITIKISKCGGLLRSKAIADLALSFNKPCHLGTHVGETPILTTAGIQFASRVENIRYFEGFSFLLYQDLSRGRISETGRAGNTIAQSGSGLGLEAEAVDQLLKDSKLMVHMNK